MSATPGITVITSNDFNSLQSSTDDILRILYGQTLLSAPVLGFSDAGLFADRPSNSQLLNLFLDIQKIYVHQFGNINPTVAVPLAGYVIGADEARTFDPVTGDSQIAIDGAKMGYNDFKSVMNIVSDFDPSITPFPSGNFSQGNTLVSTRSTSWGGESQPQGIYHVFETSFSDINQMNYFFNAGGSIRFDAALTNEQSFKDNNWKSLLSAMGTIIFTNSGTTALSGDNLGGYQDLTSSYTPVFFKTGSGIYSDNDYTIEARIIVNETKIRFRVSFNDTYAGVNDIPVTGTITHNVEAWYPDSSFIYNGQQYQAVLINSPTLSTDIQLSSNNFTSPA